jgi:hypothetical protein
MEILPAFPQEFVEPNLLSHFWVPNESDKFSAAGLLERVSDAFSPFLPF